MTTTTRSTPSSVYTNYNTSLAQVTNAIGNGDQFLLIVRNNQGQTQIWGSQDQEDAESLYADASSVFYSEQVPGG